MAWRLEQGDCLDVLKGLPDNSVESVVSDPPAGIGFMGRDWDSDKGGRESWIGWMTSVMQECLRVVKPGGHILIWAIPRTSHWTATAIENSGFEIREICCHLFGSGFPKSQDVGKFIDKLAGAERAVIGQGKTGKSWGTGSVNGLEGGFGYRQQFALTAPSTADAATWDGWGTALKPATEFWIMARKPLSESSIARNVLAHGTGAINVDACRVERAADDVPGWHTSGSPPNHGYLGTETFKIRAMSTEEIQARCGGKGRWPTNLLLSHSAACEQTGTREVVTTEDGLTSRRLEAIWTCAPDCPVAEIDRQSGFSSEKRQAKFKPGQTTSRGLTMGTGWKDTVTQCHPDSGGASRFFPTFRYQAKPSRKEREAGLDDLPTRTLNRVNPGGLENEPRFAPIQVKNNHPTVKSQALMTWLITLITPPGGTVLDPFAGSGSTGVAAVAHGFGFLGIEKDAAYCQIAEHRIAFAAAEADGQQSLFDEEIS